MRHYDVVIVGAGHGGAQAAIALRQNGFAGSIAMVGRDREPPYERPPLSKDYLAGEKPFERLYIRPPGFWADKGIDLVLGTAVTAIDPAGQVLSLSAGEPLGYGTLIWSAGGDPRRLSCSGADLAGVHAVRDKADVDRLAGELAGSSRQVAVIGGGYIGLEAAAVLVKLGHRVTVLEAQPRVLNRVVGPALSAFYEREHRARGVDLRLGATVDCLVGDGARVTGVRLAAEDGTDGDLPADLVVVGIGIVPAIGPLIAAGAAGANGVDIDEFCRTSLPGIYAIGDCAAHASDWADGAVVRIESVQNAHDMASVAAGHVCGGSDPYRALPWFWSNQYDLRLQTAGFSTAEDTEIVRGDPATRSFSVAYLRDGRLAAIDCVNRTKDYVAGRKLIEARVAVDAADIADAERPLKDLL